MQRLTDGQLPVNQEAITMQSSYLPQEYDFTGDPHRPRYHFLPPGNWLNDPNGLIQWQDEYHLFYQYNPNGAFHGTIHWGHAASRDLVHWQHLPVALTPTPGSADEDGCWSGYTVNDNGTPTLIYTGIREEKKYQLPCLATSRDGLVSWQKYEGNPIIAGPPPGLEVLGFRDHCVWQAEADGLWYQAIGTGFRGGGAAVLLYSSPDLRRWQYLHPLFSGDYDLNPEIWECPDFFRLGDEHVLIISSTSRQYPLIFTGPYSEAERRFRPRLSEPLDPGGSLYAPQSLLDKQGRRIMWGWLREGRSPEAARSAGWSGAMSLPLVLNPPEAGRSADGPGLSFAPELSSLRRRHYGFEGLELAAGQDYRLEGVEGDCLEIAVEFEAAGPAGEYGLAVRCSPDRAEQTRLVVKPATRELMIDRRRSSLTTPVQPAEHGGLYRPYDDETVRLRLFLDRSIIELNVNGRDYFSSRIYPAQPDSLGVSLFAGSGGVKVKSLDVWELASIW